MKSENLHIKTANGTVDITRSANKATITEHRICFGFSEKKVTTVLKLNDSCMHFVFGDEKQIIETLKNQ